jgi:uncharacterized protein
MGNPVVHFEITGTDPPRLRNYYGELFGWEFDTSGPVSSAVSEPGNYGFTDGNTTSDGIGIPGGVGGGRDYEGHALFYVGVPDVEIALQKAERLGGTRRMGPSKTRAQTLSLATSPTPKVTSSGSPAPSSSPPSAAPRRVDGRFSANAITCSARSSRRAWCGSRPCL